jgi:PPE-repeat protein
MYGYASSSAAATKLTVFNPPPQTTNPAAASTQAAATAQAGATPAQSSSALSQLITTVPNALQGLASGAAFDPIGGLEGLLNTPLVQALNTTLGTMGGDFTALSGASFAGSVVPFFLSPILPLAIPAAAAASDAAAVGDVSAVSGGAVGPTLVGSYGSGASGSGVSAGLATSGSIGGLSVPPSWGQAAGEIRLAATALPAGSPEGLAGAAAAGPGGWFGGLPPVGSVVNAPRRAEATARSGKQVSVLAGQPGGADAPGAGVPGEAGAAIEQSPLSAGERVELDELRKQLAELAMRRDAAARVIREAIQP